MSYHLPSDDQIKDALERILKKFRTVQSQNKLRSLVTQELNKKKKGFFDLLDSLNLSKEDRELFLAVNKLNQWRQTRDRGRRMAYYNMKPWI